MQTVNVPSSSDIYNITEKALKKKLKYLENRIEIIIKRIYKLEEEVKILNKRL